ncbi:hypothetical protein GCG54_00010286 [Colletotrichum gloeosporioides]|uniref:Suppressor of anucleate metulae protein B n=1 Tax=Colletotrichum gloeosporioides TaxID=474922 RepID=A0A8H4CC16_COLGL|nr:uncharacterized protein GCG54_00010286 [Colletotrichum gloeosporioides]KAF3801008.1 hypothetical protein GCG54_00010286 [Colletotrichum gloeosporioides]
MAKACQKCKKDITDEAAECDRCDVNCQNLHWKNHKKSCARTRTANPSEPPRYTTYGREPPSSSTAWNPSRPTPSRGLEAPIMNAFTNLEKRTFLHNHPEKDVYKILIDYYRLRMEDDAKIVGIMSQTPSTSLGLAMGKPDSDASWRRQGDQSMAGSCRFGGMMRSNDSARPWLLMRLSKADVIQHCGDDHIPMQLRMIEEFVWGSAPGRQDGTQMRRMLASRETSTAGPGFVEVLHIDNNTKTGYGSAFN